MGFSCVPGSKFLETPNADMLKAKTNEIEMPTSALSNKSLSERPLISPPRNAKTRAKKTNHNKNKKNFFTKTSVV